MSLSIQSREPELSGGGRYRIESFLAEGGMGRVYSALDTSTGRVVALKRLRARRTSSPIHFELEYHTLAQLQHPGIIEVFEYGVDAEGPYYTMELLDGTDLTEVAPLPYREACKHLRTIASSLSLLHTRRLLHRDLSPRNVRITSEGQCKLLDFGAMARFGAARNLVGTPPLVSPEAFRRQAMDQRSDLYSLGALAYWLLTGAHAFPAKRIEDLPELWRFAPPRPSSVVTGIPAELDALVLSMLRAEPELRPQSAIEVIDRLQAIAGLPAEDQTSEARSFLLTSRLVGRDREVAALREAAAGLSARRGATILFQGTRGVGRSRLLHEAALLAQLSGATVIQAAASAPSGDHALARQLVEKLFAAIPDLGKRIPARSRALLSRLVPGLAGQPAALPAEPLDRRSVLHAAVVEAFQTAASVRQLAVIVDDAHFADESSLGILVRIARGARHWPLLLVASAEPWAAASGTAAALENAAHTENLHRLGMGQVAELVLGLFGDVSGTEMLAAWLMGRTRGSPAQCLDLCRHLVEQGVIRYADGLWVLPTDLSGAAVPESVAEALGSELDALSAGARALLDVICVARGPLSLDAFRAAARDVPAFFEALGELVSRDLIVARDDRYELSRPIVRATVAARIPEARMRALHDRIGRQLLESEQSTVHDRLEAGFHLSEGGAALEGAELLADSALSLSAQGDLSRTVLVALEQALAVIERHGGSRLRVLELKTALVGGYQFDRSLALRHGPSALEELSHCAGLDVIARLTPRVGRRAALAAGLVAASARRVLALAREGAAPTFRQAMQLFGRCLTATAGASATVLDVERLDQLSRYISPLSAFPENSGAYVIHALCNVLRDQISGSEAEHARKSRAAIERLDDVTSLSAQDKRKLETAFFYGLGIGEAYRGRSRALECADRLDELGSAFARFGAQHVRYCHHLLRGETLLAEPFRSRMEERAIESGMMWKVEFFSIGLEGIVAALTQDIVFQKRCVETLRNLRQVEPSVAVFHDSVVASYRLSLGEFDEARRIAEGLVARHPPRSLISWALFRAQLAAAYVLLGEAARAKALLLETAEHVDDADREYVCYYAPLDLALGNAEIALGDLMAARAIAQRMLDRDDLADHPLMRSLFLGLAARATFAAGDLERAQGFVTQMRLLAAVTGNAALVRYADRTLLEVGGARGGRELSRQEYETQTVSRVTEAWGEDSSRPLEEAAGLRLPRND